MCAVTRLKCWSEKWQSCQSAQENLCQNQRLRRSAFDLAIFTPEGCQNLFKKSDISIDQTEFTTCAIIDFSDFETEVSCIGFGAKPTYDYTTKYMVTVDDFFLTYLQSSSIPITIFHTNGMEFRPIGYTLANFQQIVTEESLSFTYISDILSNERTVIGQLEYRLEIEISMPLAIRAFHERSTALNLISKSTADMSGLPSIQGPTNNLHIKIKGGIFEQRVGENEPLVPLIYGTIHFDPLWRSIIIPPKLPTHSPKFLFETAVPLKTTADLDRQLRSSKILIAFADDAEDYVYGYVKVPLIELALGHSVAGNFDVQDAKGVPCGTIWVEVSWDSPYEVDGIRVHCANADGFYLGQRGDQERDIARLPSNQSTSGRPSQAVRRHSRSYTDSRSGRFRSF
jgi:First C2 domain of RPGR-interacting protein 1